MITTLFLKNPLFIEWQYKTNSHGDKSLFQMLTRIAWINLYKASVKPGFEPTHWLTFLCEQPRTSEMRGFLNIGTKPLFLKWKYYRQRINVAATTQRLNSNKCKIDLKIVQRVHSTIIVRFEDRKRWELNPRPGTPHFFLLCFSSIPAPWYSGWVVGCMHRDLAVAYLEICGELDLHPVHHSPKQQCLVT